MAKLPRPLAVLLREPFACANMAPSAALPSEIPATLAGISLASVVFPREPFFLAKTPPPYMTGPYPGWVPPRGRFTKISQKFQQNLP